MSRRPVDARIKQKMPGTGAFGEIIRWNALMPMT